MENLFKLIGILFIIVLALLSSLWTTYILWDICILYDLTFLTVYGYKMFFGTLLIWGALIASLKRKSKEKETSEIVGEWFGIQFGWFAFWGLAYLYHWLLNF